MPNITAILFIFFIFGLEGGRGKFDYVCDIHIQISLTPTFACIKERYKEMKTDFHLHLIQYSS